ncbi:MAG: hypothetical protein JJU28_19740 [Cyclobacteriaceae bacterium]|nr:hypothetical protein [Cyclobacteriaceae bacterium]
MSPSVISQFIDGRTIKIDGKIYLFCSGTAYLGIPYTEEFKRYFEEGLHYFGTGYAGSPAGNMRLSVYEYTEECMKGWLSAEDVLCLSSGMLAGQCVVNYFYDKADFIYLNNSHPALWQHSPPARYFHPEHDLQKIQETIDAAARDTILILASSADVLTPSLLSFDFLRQLEARGKCIVFVLDDSHAFGVIGGDTGQGHYALLKKNFPLLDVLVLGSLGKGTGIPAGVIAGNHTWIKQIRDTAFYRSASPPVPAALYAFNKVWPSLYQQQYATLQQIIKQLKSYRNIADLFNFISSYPVFVSKNEGLYNHMLHHDIWLSSFPYPSSEDLPVTRLVLNALHTEEDMNRIHLALESFVS